MEVPEPIRRLGGLAVIALLAVAAIASLRASAPVAATASGPATAAAANHTVLGGSGSSTTTSAATAQGQALYLQSCASCHGSDGKGTANGPDISGVGAGGADFMMSTGRMPLSAPGEPSYRQPPSLSDPEIAAIAAYVASLGSGPGIPSVVTSLGDLHRGWELFINNCAACHGAAAGGDAVGGGAIAPPLDKATATQIAEAMALGPGQMPAFDFSTQDVDAIVRYVLYLRQAPSPGGLDLGNLGPVPEGFVALVIGVGLLVWLTRRIEPVKPREVHEGPPAQGPPAEGPPAQGPPS
jgi:ubiquinol-cytochrome c reductase cytochrome c subunit